MLTKKDFVNAPVNISDMKRYIIVMCSEELAIYLFVENLTIFKGAEILAEEWIKEPARIAEVENWLINY